MKKLYALLFVSVLGCQPQAEPPKTHGSNDVKVSYEKYTLDTPESSFYIVKANGHEYIQYRESMFHAGSCPCQKR